MMAAFRIFIADDHEVVRKGLCALLQAEPGWEICGEAGNGREAAEKVRELKPDAIILDIGMPGLNGLEILARLKQHRDTRHVPVHLVSARDKKHRGLKHGARAYLEEPARKAGLDNRILASG